MNRRDLLATSFGVVMLGIPTRLASATPIATPAAVNNPLDFVDIRYYHSSSNARYRSVRLGVAQWESAPVAQATLDAFLTPGPITADHDELSVNPPEPYALPPLAGADFASLVTWSTTEGAAAYHTGYARLALRRESIGWTAAINAENASAAIDLAITFAEHIAAWQPTGGHLIDSLPGLEMIPDGMWLDSIHTPEGVTRDDPREDDQIAIPDAQGAA